VLLGARIEKPVLLFEVLFLGDIGLAAASTLLGAIASQARARGALFSAIAVPILLPLLVSSSVATAGAMGASGASGASGATPSLGIIAAYDVILVAASWILFDFVWSA